MKLYDFQLDAIRNIHNGSILNGSVGAGKSITALGYFYIKNGGSWDTLRGGKYEKMKNPQNLLIITTAAKRDKLEWESELQRYFMSIYPEHNLYKNTVVVDSWQNIRKYVDISGYMILFDEDHLTGSGVWVKTFYKMAKNNDWFILSATPGDSMLDYLPVMVANGFYRNKTEFIREHVIYNPRTNFPKVDRYINTGRFNRFRRQILVDMEFKRDTKQHHYDIYVDYPVKEYKQIIKERYDPWNDCPIENAAGLCYCLRKCCNMDESRQVKLLELFEKHPRVIIFYNFDHELDILEKLCYGENVEIARWNGHIHQPVPKGKRWVYLVQYTACEGWNAITTDTIIFFSQNYSYKNMIQAAGRIDRLNTPYTDLYYYHLKSRSGIDLAISKALKEKKKFNESAWVGGKFK